MGEAKGIVDCCVQVAKTRERDFQLMDKHILRLSGRGNDRRDTVIGVLGLIAIFLFLSTTAFAETGKRDEAKDILVIGTGTIVEGNTAQAREAAISDALVRGMEEYLARRLGSQGMVNNFQRLIMEVIPMAGELVENFNILAAEEGDGYYKVLVRLKINDSLTEEKFREIGLVEIAGPPVKVLFLVSQVELPSGEASYWWRDPEGYTALTPAELSLHRAFEARGFQPINRMLKVPEATFSPEMKALDMTSMSASKWGRAFSADVVIYGRCAILESKEVFVNLAALDVQREFVIDQADQGKMVDQSSEDVIQTMERVIDKVASTLSPSILRSISTLEAKLSRLEITLKGLGSFKEFRMLRDFLEGDVEGVKSVRQTSVKGNIISIAVEFSGDEDVFLEKVLQHEKLPFPVDVIKTEEGETVFNIR